MLFTDCKNTIPGNWMMTVFRNRYRIAVFTIALYVPIQDYLMNVVPEGWRLMIRFGLEGCLSLLFVLLFIEVTVLRRERFNWGGFLYPVTAFLAVSTCSALYNGSGLVPMIVSYYPLLRYVFLIYLIVLNSEFTELDARRLVGLLLVVVLMECFIASVQFWGGEGVSGHFRVQPAHLDALELGRNIIEPRAMNFAFGTMGRYNILGLFLFFFAALSLGLILAGYRRKLMLPLGMAVLVALTLTCSRQAWLGFMAAALVSGFITIRKRRAWLMSLLVILTVTGALIVFSSVDWGKDTTLGIFSERIKEPFRGEYMQAAIRENRLFYLVNFPVLMGKNGLDALLLGFGPGTLGERQAVLFGSTPLDTFQIPRSTQFLVTDVMYAYVLGQAGLLGLGAFLWIIAVHLRRGFGQHLTPSDPFLSGLRIAYPGILVGLVLTCFFGPNFEIRPVSLYVWLLAAWVTKYGHGRAITPQVARNGYEV